MPKSRPTTLDRLAHNLRAKITKIVSDDREFITRLNALGLVDGSMIRVIHSQPFGGPLSIRVRGVTLSLRRSEADKISVQVVE